MLDKLARLVKLITSGLSDIFPFPAFFRNQETYLRRYLEDGHLSIDNNSAERAIKNFAVGRRNWLFSKSIRGADASATIYSITETALLNGLKPYLYLTYVLDQLRRMGSFPEEEKLDQLLPWSKELPEELRTTE